MKTEIMIAVLALLCIGSMAAAFVLWAKVDEYKRTAQDEHANYIAALNLHNTTAERAQRLDHEQEVIYGQLNKLSIINFDLHLDNAKLQDRLSALLCPHNDHVWEDGRCVKCGRMQDG
jgi:hypothetical protein